MNYRWLTHVLSGRSTNINARRRKLAPSCINISWSALQQHVLISDNSRVRKNYFLTKNCNRDCNIRTSTEKLQERKRNIQTATETAREKLQQTVTEKLERKYQQQMTSKNILEQKNFHRKTRQRNSTGIPRNAVSRLPALGHKKEVNLISLPFLRNTS